MPAEGGRREIDDGVKDLMTEGMVEFLTTGFLANHPSISAQYRLANGSGRLAAYSRMGRTLAFSSYAPGCMAAEVLLRSAGLYPWGENGSSPKLMFAYLSTGENGFGSELMRQVERRSSSFSQEIDRFYGSSAVDFLLRRYMRKAELYDRSFTGRLLFRAGIGSRAAINDRIEEFFSYSPAQKADFMPYLFFMARSGAEYSGLITELYRAFGPADIKNAFEILGLDNNATFSDVKKAYRSLARQYHPDVADMDREMAGERFKEISAAYTELEALFRSLQ